LDTGAKYGVCERSIGGDCKLRETAALDCLQFQVVEIAPVGGSNIDVSFRITIGRKEVVIDHDNQRRWDSVESSAEGDGQPGDNTHH